MKLNSLWTLCARFFSVSRSGYYAWRSRNPGGVKVEKENALPRSIEEIYLGSRSTYGSLRIFNILQATGHEISETKVEKTTKMNGIRSKVKRKFRVTTDSKHTLPIAPNLLKRNFSPERANQTWAGDVTYIWTREWGLFLAVVIDLFSRQVG